MDNFLKDREKIRVVSNYQSNIIYSNAFFPTSQSNVKCMREKKRTRKRLKIQGRKFQHFPKLNFPISLHFCKSGMNKVCNIQSPTACCCHSRKGKFQNNNSLPIRASAAGCMGRRWTAVFLVPMQHTST